MYPAYFQRKMDVVDDMEDIPIKNNIKNKFQQLWKYLHILHIIIHEYANLARSPKIDFHFLLILRNDPFHDLS